ncbi:sigma-E factor negative regulatory protein [Schlegelella aquatica]|uniref:sigma-E factor negative regulatory protein n=1 Tax=Caldimonas aquatica TaxID=376175 RepID=UPI003751288E
MSMDGVDRGLSRQARERLSALADGEAGTEDLQQTLAAWRDDPAARAGICETWHLYHLIGDVMRSDELAGRGRDDVVFVARLRERLSAEPPIVAPAPLTAPAEGHPSEADEEARRALVWRRRRRAWTAPLATAAGVMAVVGVLSVTRTPEFAPAGGGAGLTLTGATPAAPAAVQPVALQASASPALPASQTVVVHTPSAQPQLANGALVRDARLDQYLSAHKQFDGSSALGVPSGFLRSATYEGPSR